MERKFELPPFGTLAPEKLLPKSDIKPIGKTLTGLLDQWHCPIVKLRLIKESAATPFVLAVIDTGSYNNYISADIAEAMEITESGWYEAAVNPSTGMQENIFTPLQTEFQALPDIMLSMQFGIVNKAFSFPVILGTRFLSNFNLRYFGRENRFELDL